VAISMVHRGVDEVKSIVSMENLFICFIDDSVHGCALLVLIKV